MEAGTSSMVDGATAGAPALATVSAGRAEGGAGRSGDYAGSQRRLSGFTLSAQISVKQPRICTETQCRCNVSDDHH